MSNGHEHYLPRADDEFAAWLGNFMPSVLMYYDSQGLDTGTLAALQSAVSVWEQAYPAHIAAQAAAEGASQRKDSARRGLEAQVRPVVRFVQGYPATSDANRATMGIALRPAGRSRTPAPASAPLIVVVAPARYTHQLRLIDAASPTRRARPRGAERAEVYMALTDNAAPAPADPAAYRYVGSVSSGSTVVSFEPEQGGRKAHYLARWVTMRNLSGPWSEGASATVAA